MVVEFCGRGRCDFAVLAGVRLGLLGGSLGGRGRVPGGVVDMTSIQVNVDLSELSRLSTKLHRDESSHFVIEICALKFERKTGKESKLWSFAHDIYV